MCAHQMVITSLFLPIKCNNPNTPVKMKMFIVLAALVAIAAAAPQNYHDNTYIVRETPHNNIGIGGYNFGYELSNGESRQEFAEMRNAGSENAFLVVRGSYTMVDPATGQQYVINYVADENGFHPEGDHLPI